MLHKENKSFDKKKILHYIGYAIVIIMMALLIAKADFKLMLHHIKAIPIEVLMLLLILQLGTQILLGLQWHGITKTVLGKSSFLKMLYVVSMGNVVEAITPGAKVGGEFVRLYYIKNEFKCTLDKATNIILIQKSISMSVLFTICTWSLLSIGKVLGRHVSDSTRFIIVGLSICLIVFMISSLFYSKGVVRFLSRHESRFIKKLNKWIGSYSESTELMNKKAWVGQFLISNIIWLLFPIKMVILASSMGIHMPFFLVIAITMTSYMMGMLPITPGGIGTFEGTMVILFGIVNVPGAVAFSMSIVFRVITFWFVIGISTIYAAIYR